MLQLLKGHCSSLQDNKTDIKNRNILHKMVASFFVLHGKRQQNRFLGFLNTLYHRKARKYQI